MDPQHEEQKVPDGIPALQHEDPMDLPDIQAVLEFFPDQEPAVLYDIYVQVGRNKELLIETVMNGG